MKRRAGGSIILLLCGCTAVRLPDCFFEGDFLFFGAQCIVDDFAKKVWAATQKNG